MPSVHADRLLPGKTQVFYSDFLPETLDLRSVSCDFERGLHGMLLFLSDPGLSPRLLFPLQTVPLACGGRS